MKKKTNIILVLILLGGFAIRLLYLFYFKDSVYFNPMLMERHDQRTFILWAQDILRHPWAVDGQVFFMAPLYPYFLAFLLFITAGNLLMVSVLQILMDVSVCLMLFYLGKKVYNERAGLLAAFMGAFYRTFIVYSAAILSDGLVLFLYILFPVMIFYSLEKPNICRWVIAGIVLGLAALAKPTIAILLPFVLVCLYLYRPEKRLTKIKNIPDTCQPLAVLGLLIIVSGLIILPITIRNYYVSGVFAPICSNGLVNWRIGNSYDSLGLYHIPEGELMSIFSAGFWRLFLEKLHMFFMSYEWPQNLNVHFLDMLIPVLRAAFFRFGFVVPVGLGGLILLCKKWKKNSLFISFIIFNVLWVVLFFITDRFRTPAVACFMVSGSVLIVWTIEKLRNSELLKPLSIWLSVALFAFFFNMPPGPLVPEVTYGVFADLSIKNIQEDISNNDLEDAFAKAESFFTMMPDDFRSNYMLATVFYRKHNLNAAIMMLNRTLELNPEFEPARVFMEDINGLNESQ